MEKENPFIEKLKAQNAERIERNRKAIREHLEESLENAKTNDLHFFGNFVGVRFIGFDADVFATETESKPHILNTYGVLQGGAAATIADVTMGFMLLRLYGDVVTLEMKTNYVNAGKGKVFKSFAKVIGHTGRHIICECKTLNEDGTLITYTTGTFVQRKSEG